MFHAINECDSEYKEWCFLFKQMVIIKMCDTNKNLIKMGMIVKGVYYSAKMHGTF